MDPADAQRLNVEASPQHGESDRATIIHPSIGKNAAPAPSSTLKGGTVTPWKATDQNKSRTGQLAGSRPSCVQPWVPCRSACFWLKPRPSGGEGGIRAHGTVTRTTVFEFYDSHVGLCRAVAKRALWFGIFASMIPPCYGWCHAVLRGSFANPFAKVDRIAMISAMRTARPTTGSPLSVLEAGTAPFDPVSSCFCFFCRLDPADPFIARKRRNILPRLQRFGVGGQCLFQIRGQIMDHTA
jgi:hypothetical protein